jgi:hypothetical protein
MASSSGPPFFIVGSARSGTTLLRLMLNAHREVAVPPESRFITELWRGADEISVHDYLSGLARHKRFQAWDLPIEAVANELQGDGVVPYSSAVDATFRAWARVQGKTRWGDKTPRYIEDIPLLSGLFPDARFIHLVRDGRNVALSYADVPFGPKTIEKAARLWGTRVTKGLHDGRALGRGHYLEVRYEDLVEDAEGEAKDICDFIDLEFDPEMLDYTERARAAVLPRAALFNPRVMEKPTSSVRDWHERMPPAQVEVFEAIAGDVLSELGYERRYSSARPWVRAKVAASKLGLALDRLPKGRQS